MDLLEKVQMENLDEEQKALAELIGLEAFKNLVRAFNGTSIYIPKIESLEKTVRDELIKEEFDGGNYKELALKYGCLLYTSDAADEEDSVDLGGRRIIQKKKKVLVILGRSML